MAHKLLPTLRASLEGFRVALTEPSFSHFVVLFVGWVRSTGTHAVTEALLATGVAGQRHHEAYHRFFSRGTWSPDRIGRWLFFFIESLLLPGAPICIVLDDTLAPKKGPHVFGIGSHIDPVRSTVARKVFCFGHCWVVLAVILPVPLCRSTFALPLLFRLYTNKKACEKKNIPIARRPSWPVTYSRCLSPGPATAASTSPSIPTTPMKPSHGTCPQPSCSSAPCVPTRP